MHNVHNYGIIMQHITCIASCMPCNWAAKARNVSFSWRRTLNRSGKEELLIRNI